MSVIPVQGIAFEVWILHRRVFGNGGEICIVSRQQSSKIPRCKVRKSRHVLERLVSEKRKRRVRYCCEVLLCRQHNRCALKKGRYYPVDSNEYKIAAWEIRDG